MQRYIRELLHPKQARKVSALSGKRSVTTKSSASRFICVPDGPKVGFLFLTECASLPLNVLIRDDGLHSYAKSEITGNLKKSICLAMSMREICENSSVPRHFLTIERGLHYLRASAYKYGPSNGTSRKIDFAHFWPIDWP